MIDKLRRSCYFSRGNSGIGGNEGMKTIKSFSVVCLLVALSVWLAACASAVQPTPTAAPKAPAAEATKPAAQPTAAAAATKPAAVPTPAATQAQPASKAPAEAPKQVTKLEFGLLPAVASSPTFVAIERGYMKEQGLDLSLERFPDTVQIMTLIATGKLQFGQATMGAAAFNSFARGTDMIIIASANQDPEGPSLTTPVIIRKDLIDSGQVKTVADLKGKKIGLNGKGTIMEWEMAKMLANGGLKIEDVDVPIMPWPDMIPALGNKAIDGGMIGEPTATQAVAKGVGARFVNYSIPAAQLGTIFANKVYAKENPQIVRNFLVAYLKAIRDMNYEKMKQDPKVLESIFNLTKVPVDTLKEMPALRWDSNGRVIKESILDVQKFMIERKSVQYTDPLPITTFVDESYLEQALAVVGTAPKQ